MATPHRVVDSIADGIANGARGLINSAAAALKGAGSTIVGAVDKPFRSITGKEGPLMMADRLANGAVDTATDFVDGGIIGGMQSAGKTVMKALDHPPEQIGIPPDIEKFGFLKGSKK